MNCYKVNFGDYTLLHAYDETYFDYFEFNNKKYPIGSHIILNDKGMKEMYYNGCYNYQKGDFRLVDHWVDRNRKEKWKYLIGWRDSYYPIFYTTMDAPLVFVKEVVELPFDETFYTPGELKVEFKEPNYNPSDCNVEGVMCGWVVFFVIWISAFFFKDWWIVLLIQISAGWYFGNWRENKINEAIRKQKFKE